MFLDFEERDSNQTGSFVKEENSKTMKTSEEAVDFEKEFRPDDVGKDKIEFWLKTNMFYARTASSYDIRSSYICVYDIRVEKTFYILLYKMYNNNIINTHFA